MERLLGELLEDLDKAFPKRLSIKDLVKTGFSKELILGAIADGLLNYPIDMRGDFDLNKAFNDDTLPVVLSANGFLMLNQIKLKKATDELNRSIRDFDKSSKFLSWIMIGLTIVIALLTALMLFQAK